MSNLSAETPKQWNIYARNDPNQSQTEAYNRDGQWKNFGSSMDAISFGFVATAILISMFIIMAIFEHLFKPTETFSSDHHTDHSHRNLESTHLRKLGDQEMVTTSTYALDFSVLMPGQQYPTFIAQPAPLPCQREGVCWPSHELNFALP